MANILIAIAGLVLLYSAYSDIRYRILPDTLSLILISLAVVRWSWAGDWSGLGWSFACALGLFVLSAAAFARGWLGGGDVKLMTATSFFVGSNSFLPFIIMMSFAVGGLSLLVLLKILVRRVRGAGRPHGSEVQHTVPYGAAIALAGLYILYVQDRLGVN